MLFYCAKLKELSELSKKQAKKLRQGVFQDTIIEFIVTTQHSSILLNICTSSWNITK
jgi:hypothetical protein